MNNYPPGAANDPDAPYNQPLPEPYSVLVSMTFSKEFTINIINKGDRLINETDVRLEHFLPDEILDIVSKTGDISRMQSDAADWDVDEIAVIES